MKKKCPNICSKRTPCPDCVSNEMRRSRNAPYVQAGFIGLFLIILFAFFVLIAKNLTPPRPEVAPPEPETVTAEAFVAYALSQRDFPYEVAPGMIWESIDSADNRVISSFTVSEIEAIPGTINEDNLRELIQPEICAGIIRNTNLKDTLILQYDYTLLNQGGEVVSLEFSKEGCEEE